jgi:hypothetical protein
MKKEILTKADVIDKILAIELGMILNLPSAWRSFYREHPERFKLSRYAQFFPWSQETLESYLDDLETALSNGLNLIALRMDNVRNNNPLVDVIIAHQCLWQREIIRKYPVLMSGRQILTTFSEYPFLTSFEVYLKGELETYSDKTLELLHMDILNKHEQGMNMMEETYTFLIQELGFESLHEAEDLACGRQNVRKTKKIRKKKIRELHS